MYMEIKRRCRNDSPLRMSMKIILFYNYNNTSIILISLDQKFYRFLGSQLILNQNKVLMIGDETK